VTARGDVLGAIVRETPRVLGVRVGGFLQNQKRGGNGVGLADTGGEPSTQAEGCLFSTNEKKLHGTFDEEFIEGTAKLVTHEGYNVAGAVRWFS